MYLWYYVPSSDRVSGGEEKGRREKKKKKNDFPTFVLIFINKGGETSEGKLDRWR